MTLFVTRDFLEDMALIMCVAALATDVCQWLRQPLIVGYLITGIVVGPNTPGVFADPQRIQLVSDLGVILLVFSIGLEFKFRQLMRLAPTAGLVAVVQAAAMILLGYLVGRLAGWTPWESLVTGAMIAFSGAVILAKAFEEVQVKSSVRELVFGVVLCEDLISILLLAVLTTMANGGTESLHGLSITAGLLGSFIVVLIAVGWITVPYLVRGVARFKRRETMLITATGLCFVFATIAERAGYSVAVGAFLAGSLVAESEQGEDVEKLIEGVRDIFGAIFFVSVGMLVEPQVLVSHWHVLAMLTVVVIFGKIVVVSLASIAIGERSDAAVQAGFAMAQVGPVFAYLIAEVARSGGSTRPFLCSLAVGVSTITAFLSPFLIRKSDSAAKWLDRHIPAPVQGAIDRYGEWLERIRT
jgi:monovalent cation:H+ antiporter-2, CPA2 family